MHSMSEDDAAYLELLAQLLSDSAPSRNARVHSWIEHQYDFVLSERTLSSRPSSPSPSSSLGAHRTLSIDRPDSPLLPRLSSERPTSPCPSYDALFFSPSKSDADDFEEQERVRALRFIVQEMAHWKSQTDQSPPFASEKPLPVPPPSPASSLTQSTSSRAVRSRSSSTRISRLPSFTSTLSSDHSQPQEIPLPPPLPVSVILHGEYQHDVALRDRPLVDRYFHKRDDSFAHSLLHSREQDGHMLSPIQDDLDSALLPSPTFTTFSCAHSRDTSFTSPCASSATSPTSAVFCPSQCAPENIALPLSPVDDVPQTNIFLASPTSPTRPEANSSTFGVAQGLGAPKYLQHSQSRWSIATTASVAPSATDAKSGVLRLSPQDKRGKTLKTPRKRTRFISLISRLSPGRSDPSLTSSSLATDDAEYDSAEDSDNDYKDKSKARKSLSKKSSLASLRASFSVSRASFSSQRPPISSPIEEVPPLPTSPTLSSLTDVASLEASSPPKTSFSKIPSRANVMNIALPSIPQSASTVMFHSSSRVSLSDASGESPASRSTTGNASRVSLLPAPSKRTSLASAAGIEPMASTIPVTATQSATRSKSIFRLTSRPKGIKVPPAVPGVKGTLPSRLPSGNTSLPSPTSVRSRIPQGPAKFNPPTKLATVIAMQSLPVLVPANSVPTPSISKLPISPSRIPPKAIRPVIATERSLVGDLSPSTRLPMPASIKGTRVGTVKGFWKRQ